MHSWLFNVYSTSEPGILLSCNFTDLQLSLELFRLCSVARHAACFLQLIDILHVFYSSQTCNMLLKVTDNVRETKNKSKISCYFYTAEYFGKNNEKVMYSPTECMVHMWIILLLFSFGKICKNTLFYFRKSRYFLTIC